MYYLWLNQGGGCDYNIGCGQVLHPLKAKTIEEARKEIPEIFEYYGMHDSDSDVRIKNASIVTIAEEFDVKAWLKKQDAKKSAVIMAAKESEEKAQYERLKAKFSKTAKLCNEIEDLG